MRFFKIAGLSFCLLFLFNACGIHLDVRKRVHRPGFYVNLTHEKDFVRVKQDKEDGQDGSLKTVSAASSDSINQMAVKPEKAPTIASSKLKLPEKRKEPVTASAEKSNVYGEPILPFLAPVTEGLSYQKHKHLQSKSNFEGFSNAPINLGNGGKVMEIVFTIGFFALFFYGLQLSRFLFFFGPDSLVRFFLWFF